MSLGRTRAGALLALQGAIVEIEADISSGLPKFILIGLPDAALKQAEHRVHAAAINAGCPLPTQKYTSPCPPPRCRNTAPASTLPSRSHPSERPGSSTPSRSRRSYISESSVWMDASG